jgi:hypothetical protein
MGSDIRSFVDSLRAADPIVVDGITFYPLLHDAPDAPSVILLEDSIARGLLEVRETGRVNELEAHNSSAETVLLLEGDIVQGGRQNRVINTTLAVGPHAVVKIPASCVERGRWAGDAKHFTQSGFMVSPAVKASLKRSVHDSVVMTLGKSHMSDQSAVWENTSTSLHETQAMNRTEDHLEAYRAKAVDLDKQVADVCAALFKSGAVAGVAVVRADRRAAVEAFGSKSIAAKVLPRIVRAHLLSPAKGKTEDAPSKFLEDVREATSTSTSVVGAGGVGEELRLSRARMKGLAFVLDAVTLHLSADWSDEAAARRDHNQTVIMRRPDALTRAASTDIAVVTLKEGMDAAKLEQKIAPLRERGCAAYVLNLANVKSVDRALLDYARTLPRAVLAAPGPDVRATLPPELRVFDSVDEAVRSFRAP